MYNRILGDNIRRKRKSKQMSQEHLAFYAGMTTKGVSQIELGNGNPTLNTICAIAVVLDTTPAQLLKGDVDDEPDNQ